MGLVIVEGIFLELSAKHCSAHSVFPRFSAQRVLACIAYLNVAC